MSACAQGAQWRRALVLLDAMALEMLAPWLQGFEWLPNHLCWVPQPSFRDRVVQEPDQISFNTALDACCKGQTSGFDPRGADFSVACFWSDGATPSEAGRSLSIC